MCPIRPHSSVVRPGIETARLFFWGFRWWRWYAFQFLARVQWLCRSTKLLSLWRWERRCVFQWAHVLWALVHTCLIGCRFCLNGCHVCVSLLMCPAPSRPRSRVYLLPRESVLPHLVVCHCTQVQLAPWQQIFEHVLQPSKLCHSFDCGIDVLSVFLTGRPCRPRTATAFPHTWKYVACMLCGPIFEQPTVTSPLSLSPSLSLAHSRSLLLTLSLISLSTMHIISSNMFPVTCSNEIWTGEWRRNVGVSLSMKKLNAAKCLQLFSINAFSYVNSCY